MAKRLLKLRKKSISEDWLALRSFSEGYRKLNPPGLTFAPSSHWTAPLAVLISEISMGDVNPQNLGEELAELAAQRAFKIYQDKEFRQLINFESLEKTEQDRIFNELVITGLVLEMQILEAPDLNVPIHLRERLMNVKEEIPQAHLKEMQNLGIEKRFIRLWEKLIKMRYEEFQREKNKIRSAAFESQAGEVGQRELFEIQALVPLHTAAILSFDHITRGNGKPEDPLFKMLVRWVEQLFMDVRFPIEGYKRPLLRKLWFRFKAWLAKQP